MPERHSMDPNERIKTAATGAMSAAKSQPVGGAGFSPAPPTVVDAQSVEAIIADWPKMAGSAAGEIIEKYGQPNERTGRTASPVVDYEASFWCPRCGLLTAPRLPSPAFASGSDCRCASLRRESSTGSSTPLRPYGDPLHSWSRAR